MAAHSILGTSHMMQGANGFLQNEPSCDVLASSILGGFCSLTQPTTATEYCAASSKRVLSRSCTRNSQCEYRPSVIPPCLPSLDQTLLNCGLLSGHADSLCREEEPITPHQTTLLKVLDSYLHSEKHPHPVAVSLPGQPGARPEHLLDMLTGTWMSLATYAQGALNRALGSQDTLDASGAATASSEGESTPLSDGSTETMSMNTPRVSDRGNQESGTAASQLHEFDLLLPKVCEALVLVTQCLTTIALRAEEAGSTRPTSDGGLPLPSPRTVMVAASTSTGQGFVECLVGTCPLVLGVEVVCRGWCGCKVACHLAPVLADDLLLILRWRLRRNATPRRPVRSQDHLWQGRPASHCARTARFPGSGQSECEHFGP